MTYKYFFILGRYPELSKHEIFSALRRYNIAPTIYYESLQVLVIYTKEPLQIQKLNKILGGTIKIGQLFQAFPQAIHPEQIGEYLTSDALFIDYLPGVDKKVAFGLSLYSYQRPHGQQSPWSRQISNLTKQIKLHLEAQGFSARYPHLDGNFLSSASVEKNRLISNGAEIVIIETPTEISIGKTLAVQEFESFSSRDYGRPKRDMDSGIMPPKIARMMINIAEAPLNAKILDPFCGSGTVLQEALLLGYTDIVGTDLSQKAVRDTKTNLIWLNKQHLTDSIPKVLIQDVTELSKKFSSDSIDAIVTEPYMGPNLRHKTHLKDVQKIKSELEALYILAFKQFAKIIRRKGVVVMIFPIFHTSNRHLYLDILSQVAQLGFSQVVLSNNERNSITLGTKKDYVLREIVKFKLL